MWVIVRVFGGGRWLFVYDAFLDLLPFHTKDASLPPTTLLCAGACNISRYALRLSAPLVVREAGGWGCEAARTLANMPVEGLARNLDFASINIFIHNQANDKGQMKTGAGMQAESQPMK